MPVRTATPTEGIDITSNPAEPEAELTDADDQKEVIAFLSSSQAFGSAGPIERIDTHAAIVFLAGDQAFKLKRAVDYGYLDFTTSEKRKAVCEAEHALNQRTAPEIYQGVVSINRQADGSLGFTPGEPVDWLVVMRRFPSENLLLSVAERGELTPGMVRELADGIASFHRDATVVPGADGSDRVRRVIEGNRLSMAAMAPEALSKAECESLYTASMAEAERLAALLDRRSVAGHVRRCHGDLHLANVCLWNGRPTLFDCLEFSDELATSDVLYDLAFLLMDLWSRGFRAEANLAFNRYLDMCGEADGIAAMPLFLSMRAAVRAHVCATAAGRQPEPEGRAAKLAEACEYLASALAFLEPSKPRLIAVSGLSGSGKSTLAGSLAPRIGHAPGARWLRTDVLRKRLAGVAPEVPLPESAYTRERNAEVYDRLIEEARLCLSAGRSAVVDAVFARPGERERIAGVAERAGVEFLGLWLDAPAQTLLERVASRRRDASDADAAVVRRQLGYGLGRIAPWHAIEAGGSHRQVLAAALAKISPEARDGCRESPA